MVQFIPPPEPRTLLPPLLACLPTAFVSPHPPPALLPILSPILRQRVQLLSATNGPNESWLPLLSWDKERASKLPKIVENLDIEPHPSSGEIEFEDVKGVRYRRRDEETLEARLELEEFKLLPIYLWCMTDEASGGPGWRLSELRALEDMNDGTEWFDSMDEANEGSKVAYIQDALRQDTLSPHARSVPDQRQHSNQEEQDDDDDDYWNAYDRTPGRTPARTPVKRSPAPGSNVQMPSASELEYFARYAMEVQPALDAHDPEEEVDDSIESTLNGNTLVTERQPQVEPLESTNLGPGGYDSSLPPPQQNGQDASNEINQPRPESPASSLSGSIERMEQAAEASSQAEVAIKQHISTDIKSLYRLARSAGIQREEFERVVKTELEMLSMMELDE
ncbi:hypothetical protein UCDDS831_g01517 [Diplodia seriata]|uniref:Uncharacterized protein n=1 Tax=Diplodia seriata TaxID=420778 RepID=A0A0G2ETE8_9PEZI|nr:hypothetical protein UCDDS831_g01517 [Diplodia seriata]OMP87453.1 hypothetical protein BK809_0007539 [Diplodia seriata]